MGPKVLGGDQLADVLDGEVVGSGRGVAEPPGIRAGRDGRGEHVYPDRPVTDQDRADMPVVEDDAAAPAVAREPGGAAPVAVDAVLIDLGHGGPPKPRWAR